MTMHAETQPVPGIAVSWRQLAGLAGIVGVALFVVGMALQSGFPTVNDEVADVTAWFADNGDRYLVGNFLIWIGVVLFLVPFFLGLRSALAEAEGGEAMWTQAAFFGAAIFVIIGGVGTVPSSVLAFAAEEMDTDATVRSLQFGELVLYSGIAMGFALYFLASGLVTLRTGVLWSWLGGAELILAVLAVIGSANVIDGDPEGVLAIFGWIAFIGFGVVILLQSVGLLTKKSS